MDNRELLAEYQALADDMLKGAEEHERQARDIRLERAGLLTAIDMLRPLVNEEKDDLSDLVVHFHGCTNNVDRLLRVAQTAPHKLLNTTKVSQYLLDHGQSKSDLGNYRSEINRALTTHPELFEKVSAGTYRYRGDSPVSNAVVSEAVDEAIHGPLEVPAVPEGLEATPMDEAVYGPAEGPRKLEAKEDINY